jgi:hypothetical protein
MRRVAIYSPISGLFIPNMVISKKPYPVWCFPLELASYLQQSMQRLDNIDAEINKLQREREAIIQELKGKTL